MPKIFWPDGEWKDDRLQSEPYAAENLFSSLVALTLLLNFQTFVYLHSSMSKHFSQDARLSEVTGLIFTTFYLSIPFFKSSILLYMTEYLSSKSLAALCFHASSTGMPYPHSAPTPFLTEASSLFLHTACVSILLSLFFLSSSQESYQEVSSLLCFCSLPVKSQALPIGVSYRSEARNIEL